MDLGGAPADYDVGGERVFSKSDPTKGLTYAQAAQRAVELGGKFDGHENPADINPMTAAAADVARGHGPHRRREGQSADHGGAGRVRRRLRRDRARHGDRRVRHHRLRRRRRLRHRDPPDGPRDADQGRRRHGLRPRRARAHIYDPQNGLPGAVGLYQAKPASYLDVARTFTTDAVDLPDPQSPLGTKGIGEPVMGAGASALLCAISDALGGHYFNRVPVTRDQIVNALAGRPQSHKPLQVNTA